MESKKTCLETIWDDRPKQFILGLCLLLIAGVALAGCGKGKSGSGAGGFDSASPGIKAAWAKEPPPPPAEPTEAAEQPEEPAAS